MATPRVLKNFNLFVNGRGKAGVAEEVTLPEIKIKGEGYRAGGMDAETDLDMGMDALMAKFSIADPDPETLALVGLASGNSARLVARGAFVRDSDQATIAVVAEMVGRVKSVSHGAWESGKKTKQEFEMSVNFYRLTVAGREVYRIIDGVDQLARIRSAIGI